VEKPSHYLSLQRPCQSNNSLRKRLTVRRLLSDKHSRAAASVRQHGKLVQHFYFQKSGGGLTLV